MHYLVRREVELFIAAHNIRGVTEVFDFADARLPVRERYRPD